MKKGLFCAMLIVASLVSGWCFADWQMYCSTTVASLCQGAYPGVTSNGTSVYCMLDNNKKYLCKQSDARLWWCVSYACSGQSLLQTPCSVSGMGGCKDPMWD